MPKSFDEYDGKDHARYLQHRDLDSSQHRYTVAVSAGSRNGNRYAVLDTQDRQGGKGMRRVSFHRTWAAATREAKRRNTR